MVFLTLDAKTNGKLFSSRKKFQTLALKGWSLVLFTIHGTL